MFTNYLLTHAKFLIFNEYAFYLYTYYNSTVSLKLISKLIKM